MKKTCLQFLAFFFLLSMHPLKGGQAEEMIGSFHLVARSGLYDGYRLPRMSFMINSSPKINNAGTVTFSTSNVEGEAKSGVWIGDLSGGKIIFVSSEEELISDPQINDDGHTVFEVFDIAQSRGIFLHDSLSGQVGRILSPEEQYGIVRMNDHYYYKEHGLFFRGRDFRGKHVLLLKKGQETTKYGEEVSRDGGHGLSYIFTPSFNRKGQVAFKVRLGQEGDLQEALPDEIRLVSRNGDIMNKVLDRDADSSSIFKSFANGVQLNDRGEMVFMAFTTDGHQGVYVQSEGGLREIASTRNGLLKEIEFFTPSINNKGHVVFRAKDNNGLRGIYYEDGGGLKRIVGEESSLPSDQGLRKIYHDGNHPGLAGMVDINDAGEIVFSTTIVDPERHNQTYSKAIYIFKAD